MISRVTPVLGVVAAVVAVVIAAAIVVFAVTAMSGPHLEEGKVIEKSYDDADDWYVSGSTIHGSETCTGGYNGQPRTCTRSADVVIPGHWEHEDERFLLELRGPNPEEEGKMINDTISVPEDFFNRVRVGQWVNVKSLEIIPR